MLASYLLYRFVFENIHNKRFLSVIRKEHLCIDKKEIKILIENKKSHKQAIHTHTHTHTHTKLQITN